MCAETTKQDISYIGVKETEANCPDPTAPAKTDSSADDDDDDTKADAMMQKMMKQGQDFIDRQQRK
jgi:hypothetical protein